MKLNWAKRFCNAQNWFHSTSIAFGRNHKIIYGIMFMFMCIVLRSKMFIRMHGTCENNEITKNQITKSAQNTLGTSTLYVSAEVIQLFSSFTGYVRHIHKLCDCYWFQFTFFAKKIYSFSPIRLSMVLIFSEAPHINKWVTSAVGQKKVSIDSHCSVEYYEKTLQTS